MTADLAQALTFDVQPREMEVAAAWLPPGMHLSLHGRPLQPLALDQARYAEAGWADISGGFSLAVYFSARAFRNGRLKHSRPAYHEAAAVLRRAERADTGPAAVYLVIEEQVLCRRPVLVAARVRREGEA